MPHTSQPYLLLLYQILDSTMFHIIIAPACTVYLSLSYQILDSAMFHITTAPAYIVYRSLLHQFLDSAILPQHVLSIYHYRNKSQTLQRSSLSSPQQVLLINHYRTKSQTIRCSTLSRTKILDYDVPHYHCPSTYPSITVPSHKITRFHNASIMQLLLRHILYSSFILYQISDSSRHDCTKILNTAMPHIITAPAYIPLLLSHKSQDSTVSHSITAPGICPFIIVVRKPQTLQYPTLSLTLPISISNYRTKPQTPQCLTLSLTLHVSIFDYRTKSQTPLIIIVLKPQTLRRFTSSLPRLRSLYYRRIKSQDSTMPRAVTAHLSLLYQISNSGYHYRT